MPIQNVTEVQCPQLRVPYTVLGYRPKVSMKEFMNKKFKPGTDDSQEE